MRVLLAVGNEKTAKEIAEHLINNGIEVRSCYNRIAVTAAAKEHRAEVVVLSPVLPGDEDLVADVIRPLWNDGIRIVLLPGGADLPDTRDLIKKVIPYRVYDFVYDPVTPENVLERLNNPGLPADLPKDLVRAAMLEETVSDAVPDIIPAGSKNRWGLLTKIAKKRRWKDASPDARSERSGNAREDEDDNAGQSVYAGRQSAPAVLSKERPVETVPVNVSVKEEELFRQTEKAGAFKKQEEMPEDFALLGSEKFPSVPALLAALPGNYSAVVLPSGWPNLAETIKQLRREPSVSALPIVVVGPCDTKGCYAAGADECIGALGVEAVERIRAKAARAREILALIGSGLPEGAQGAPVLDGPAVAKKIPEAKDPDVPVEDKKEISVPEADRDLLTGCCTRRHLVERFSFEGPYSVIFIDLDSFKPVNDILGHEAGDRVLSAFGEMLTRNLKGKDLAVRWGGDEFVLILPETSLKGAERVVENLRKEWKNCAPDTGNLEVGFSAGTAEGKGAAGLQRAIREADRLMYSAKKARKAKEEWDRLKPREAGPVAFPVAAPVSVKKEPWLPVFWSAVKMSFWIFAVAGMVSLAVWTADFAVRYAGGYSPYLREATKVVEWFWKTVYTGVTGKAV